MRDARCEMREVYGNIKPWQELVHSSSEPSLDQLKTDGLKLTALKNKKPSRSWVFGILINVNINVLRIVDAYVLS